MLKLNLKHNGIFSLPHKTDYVLQQTYTWPHIGPQFN